MPPVRHEPGNLVFVDDEGERVTLDRGEAQSLLALTGSLDAATVSACPTCRSRVVAVVALVDLLEASAPHRRAVDLFALAEDAPTLHLYVIDEGTSCQHDDWRDPGFTEWSEAVPDPPALRRRSL